MKNRPEQHKNCEKWQFDEAFLLVHSLRRSFGRLFSETQRSKSLKKMKIWIQQQCPTSPNSCAVDVNVYVCVWSVPTITKFSFAVYSGGRNICVSLRQSKSKNIRVHSFCSIDFHEMNIVLLNWNTIEITVLKANAKVKRKCAWYTYNTVK